MPGVFERCVGEALRDVLSGEFGSARVMTRSMISEVFPKLHNSDSMKSAPLCCYWQASPCCSMLSRLLFEGSIGRTSMAAAMSRPEHWRGSCGDKGSSTDSVSHAGRQAEEMKQERKQTSKPSSRLSCTQNKGSTKK